MRDYIIDGRERYIIFELCKASDNVHIIEVITPIDVDRFIDIAVGAYVEDFSRIRVVINAIKHRLLKQIERQEYGKRMSINELLFGGE